MLKPSSCSGRYDTENMDAYERNNIYIKELGMTMGQSWGCPSQNLETIQARIKVWTLWEDWGIEG